MSGRRSSWMVLLGCSVVLAGFLVEVRPAAAQTQGDCPVPAGVTLPADPSVTAQQVEDGSASLMDFALAARERFKSQTLQVQNLDQVLYFGCIVRQEGSAYRSGSTYLVQLMLDGRVFVHAKNMALSGTLLNPLIYATILTSLGVEPAVLAGLASPDPATAAQARTALLDTLSQEPAAPFDATTPVPGLRPGIPGASGYATVYVSVNFGGPTVLLAGFDLNESHLAQETIDYGNPSVTAADVVDRPTLKAFVTEAGEYFLQLREAGDFAAAWKAKIALRDPNGPWRHGPVYLYVLDLTSNIILFHGAFPDRFELRPLVATVRDVVTGELILPQVIEAAKSNPEGGFVEYYFDDPTDDTDSADIPKVGYAREFKTEINVGSRVVPFNFIVGSGFYTRTAPADSMTRFVPVVLDSRGKRTAQFTSELALTNRGSGSAILNFTYTADAGGPSDPATATDMLGPHQQMIASNAIEYLRGLGVPIPEAGNRVGTLRLDVSGSSDVRAVVRTTTPTAVPEGRAGLAYPGIPANEGFHDEAVYLCGLRDNPRDRSNVAVQNMGSEGSITLRITAFSGNPADPGGQVVWEGSLGPGEFHQANGVLQMAGKADPMSGGYVRVERVEGMAPFYAYGVINDNANSDGSFVFPVTANSLAGVRGQTLPVVIEHPDFTTELIFTNFSDEAKLVDVQFVADAIGTPDQTATLAGNLIPPGGQAIIPDAVQMLRESGAEGIGPRGRTIAGAAFFTAPVGDLSGVVIGARVVAQADSQDPSRGQYGVFFTAVPRGRGFTTGAWVDGLQQNEENRSNLALINTGEVDDQDIVFEIDIYDGQTATLNKTVTMDEEDKLVVPARGFRQIDQVLKLAPGTTQGYIRIRKAPGTSANPFLAYGVVNDGGAPGERTGDGAYIPARE